MMTQFKLLVNYPFKWVSCWFGFQNALLQHMKPWEMSEAVVSLITHQSSVKYPASEDFNFNNNSQ